METGNIRSWCVILLSHTCHISNRYLKNGQNARQFRIPHGHITSIKD